MNNNSENSDKKVQFKPIAIELALSPNGLVTSEHQRDFRTAVTVFYEKGKLSVVPNKEIGVTLNDFAVCNIEESSLKNVPRAIAKAFINPVQVPAKKQVSPELGEMYLDDLPKKNIRVSIICLGISEVIVFRIRHTNHDDVE